MFFVVQVALALTLRDTLTRAATKNFEIKCAY